MEIIAWNHKFTVKNNTSTAICKTCKLPIISEEAEIQGSNNRVNIELEFYLLDEMDEKHEICVSFPTFFSSKRYLEPEIVNYLESEDQTLHLTA